MTDSILFRNRRHHLRHQGLTCARHDASSKAATPHSTFVGPIVSAHSAKVVVSAAAFVVVVDVRRYL